MEADVYKGVVTFNLQQSHQQELHQLLIINSLFIISQINTHLLILLAYGRMSDLTYTYEDVKQNNLRTSTILFLKGVSLKNYQY